MDLDELLPSGFLPSGLLLSDIERKFRIRHETFVHELVMCNENKLL